MANDETLKKAENLSALSFSIVELLNKAGVIAVDVSEWIAKGLSLLGFAFSAGEVSVGLAALPVAIGLKDILFPEPDLGEVALILDAHTRVLRESDKDLTMFFRAILATNLALENWSLCPCPGGLGGVSAIETQGSIFGLIQGQQASAPESLAGTTRSNSPNRRSVNVRVHNFTGATANVLSNRNSRGGHDIDIAIGTHTQNGSIDGNSQSRSAVVSRVI